MNLRSLLGMLAAEVFFYTLKAIENAVTNSRTKYRTLCDPKAKNATF